MAAIDLDDYTAWLRGRGVAEEHLPLYREGAELVLRHVATDDTVRDVHVEAAIQVEADDGAPERRLANLRTIGARLQAYVADHQDAFAPPAADEEQPLELADVPRSASRRARLARLSQPPPTVGPDGASLRGTMVDDLAPTEPASSAAPTSSMAPVSALPGAAGPASGRFSVPAMPVPPMPFTDGPRPGVMASPSRVLSRPRELPPLPGCVCRTRQDTFPDDYWSMWGKVYLFVTATAGLFIAMMWSRLASLAVGSALVALGAMATAATAGWRCTDCRRWLARSALDEEQRHQELLRRLVFVGLAAVALIVCVVTVQKVRAELAEDRRAMEVLKQLELDETGD